MLDTNGFGVDGPSCDDAGFASECPFMDADVDVVEVLVDDPWFADVDAAAGLADRDVAVVLAGLLAMAPDAYVVARLAGIDVAGLSPQDAVAFLQVAQRTEAWHAGLQLRGYVAAGSGHAQVQEFLVLDPRPDRDEERRVRIEDAARDEVAAALRTSGQATHDRLTTARLLVGPMAATLQALESGAITPAHVRVVVDAARRLPGCQAAIGPAAASRRAVDVQERAQFRHLCALLQDRVLPVAARSTLSRTRAAAGRAVLAIDAAGQGRRRAQARASRDAFVIHQDDGLALLGIRMATEAAHACLTVIDALAHDDRFPTDCGASIGERRAEAAAALLLASPGSDTPAPRLRAHLDLTIDLTTLLGLHAGLDGTARDHRRRTGQRGCGPRPAGRPRRDRDDAAPGHRPGHRAPARPRPDPLRRARPAA